MTTIDKVVWSKDSSRGHIDISTDGKHYIVAIDGVEVGKGWIQPLRQPQGDITHYIDTKPAIGLTAADVAILRQASADIYNADPRNQRNEIRDKMQAALDNESYHRNRDDNGTGLRFAEAAKYEAEYKDLAAQLKAFDEAHPEIKAEIDAEKECKKEEARRFVENN
ncbi:MAG: hypothetical protein ABFD54_05940 [Armatimonadota bacterium]|nr:hypothetical protein [bacterium]